MNLSSRSIEARFTLASRITTLVSLAFFVGIFILMFIQLATSLIPFLFIAGALFAIIAGMTPGILIIIKRPNLAYAWRNGTKPLAFSDVPWELLSSKQRRSVYIDSMITFSVIIVFIFYAISEN